MSTDRLVIAVPSKGRLQENANAFFERAGLPVLQPGGARNYRGRLGGIDDVEIAFLSASEITREIAVGNVHLGVTGLDLVQETVPAWAQKVHLVTELGFGFADVVVAVPMAWIDVATMADLADVAAEFRARHGHQLRIATKYLNLTRRFFAEHGIADYRNVESLGATEGAPASGAAEAIVDITTTGSTLAANDLKILSDGVILKSQAHLVASRNAAWSDLARAQARTILDRVASEARARRTREVRTRLDDAAGALAAVAALGATAPFGLPAAGGPLTLHVPSARVAAVADLLRARGAATVTVARLDWVFAADAEMADALEAALG
ncbi:ATP phosphoribosyltransferase [Siculibacillus lacustris]|uniref:ATP phosphoribosyltransferase n=1 Tax=Siculibacillus lacustris TaxID=1549641 RepID=A0A4Q9VPR3_9HYPH|nr:ATP phosphoribosyltransferase [Siculibacillus lacustris]TBW37223.1 ATP phosphoribosyltransferase [Siculibacillus lacustris]